MTYTHHLDTLTNMLEDIESLRPLMFDSMNTRNMKQEKIQRKYQSLKQYATDYREQIIHELWNTDIFGDNTHCEFMFIMSLHFDTCTPDFKWFINYFTKNNRKAPHDFLEYWLIQIFDYNFDINMAKYIIPHLTNIPYHIITHFSNTIYRIAHKHTEIHSIIWILKYIQPFIPFIVDTDAFLTDLENMHIYGDTFIKSIIRAFILPKRCYVMPLPAPSDSYTKYINELKNITESRQALDNIINNIEDKKSLIKKYNNAWSSGHTELSLLKLKNDTDRFVRECLDTIRMFKHNKELVVNEQNDMKQRIREYQQAEASYNNEEHLLAIYSPKITQLESEIKQLETQRLVTRLCNDLSHWISDVPFHDLSRYSFPSDISYIYEKTHPRLYITLHINEINKKACNNSQNLIPADWETEYNVMIDVEKERWTRYQEEWKRIYA